MMLPTAEHPVGGTGGLEEPGPLGGWGVAPFQRAALAPFQRAATTPGPASPLGAPWTAVWRAGAVLDAWDARAACAAPGRRVAGGEARP